MFLALRQLVLGVSLVAMLATPSGMVSDGVGLKYGDVPASSMFVEAIEAVTDEDLMAGVGDGNFQPEREITAHELAYVLCKMNGMDVTWMNCVKVAVQEGYYDLAMASYGSRVMPYNMARVALARAGGVHGVISAGESSNDELVAFEDAKDESVGMQRGEVAHMIMRMRLWGDIIDDLKITAEPGYEQVSLEVRHKIMTYLPVEVIKAMAANKWDVDVGGTYIKEYMVKNADKGYSSVIGLCSFGQRTIHVTTSSAIIHEVGHFWSRVMCQSRGDDVLFRADSVNGRKLLGSYSTTNQLEFMAEAFRYYVENRYDDDAMAEMKAVMPTTYAEFVEREANGWIPKV